MKDQTESVHVEGLPRSKIASEMTSLQKTAGVDTVHNDEAVQVIANYDGNQDWDLGEEKRLVRKIDMRLIPILLVTFGIQSWDKVLLGFAVRVVCHSVGGSTLTLVTGHFRSDRGPRPRGRQPLSYGCFHLLSWIHCRCLSGNLARPAVSNSPGHFRYRIFVGD